MLVPLHASRPIIVGLVPDRLMRPGFSVRIRASLKTIVTNWRASGIVQGGIPLWHGIASAESPRGRC